MQEFIGSFYLWVKSFHVIAVMAWMAGMLYLPRLYAYHAGVEKGSPTSETFKVMERRLLRIILNPAMIGAWVFGLLLLYGNPDLLKQGWMHAKLLLVLGMSAIHGLFAKWRKVFERDENTRPAKFYKLWNEVPTVAMIVIVILAIAEPF